jgi:hypothetical protein
MCRRRSTQRCAANWVSSDPKSSVVYTRIQRLSQVVRLFGSVGKGATCAWTAAHAEADGLPESILPFGVKFTSARPLGVMRASLTLARNSILGDGSSLAAQRLPKPPTIYQRFWPVGGISGNDPMPQCGRRVSPEIHRRDHGAISVESAGTPP